MGRFLTALLIVLLASIAFAPPDSALAQLATTNLSNSAALSGDPSIGMGGPELFVVWKEWNPGPYAEVYFLRSRDSGGTWSAPRKLSSNSPNHEANSYDWTLSGRFIHVVWSKEDCCSGQVVYRRSTNGGATWDAAQSLWTGTRSTIPMVAASGGSNIYVVWSNGSKVYMRRSTNSGATFAGLKEIAPAGGASHGVIAFGPHVYIWWENGGEVYLRRSMDGGDTFGPIVNVSNSAEDSTLAHAAVAGSNVYVVYREMISGQNDIFLRRSSDGGATFGPAVNLSNTTEASNVPRLMLSGTIVWVSWWEWVPGNQYDIFFRRSADSGATWGNKQNLSSNAPYSNDAVMAFAGTNVHVGWTDLVSFDGSVRYRRSTNTGIAFDPTLDISANGSSYNLRLLAVGRDVFALWTDTSVGNGDIIFAKTGAGGFMAPSSADGGGGWAGESSNPAVPDWSCVRSRRAVPSPGKPPRSRCP